MDDPYNNEDIPSTDPSTPLAADPSVTNEQLQEKLDEIEIL
jgi:hypothetical protein